MYQLKQLPEDFLVKEISNFKPPAQGNYLYFKLKKKNWNTLDAVKAISKRLQLPLKNIGFAGSKDKKAITEQVISILRVKKEGVLGLKIKDIELKFLGCRNQPLTLGDLTGNYFEITIRNLDNIHLNFPKKFINYFDQQRFGQNNIEIGKNIIKKDFPKACQLLELNVKNNDYIGAIKTIPKRLLKMYVHAYQSYLWNQTVEEIIKKEIKIEETPLIGFGTNLDNLEIKDILKNILKTENLTLKDFIIKQIPELSLEGELRNIFTKVKDLKILAKAADELNTNKKKITVSFTLPKGSYATMLIKAIFKKKFIY